MTIAINRPPQRILPLSTKPTAYEVHGIRATEIEYFVAMALEKIGIEYRFQHSFLGGKGARGGIVIDFLVLTKPLATPVWVHGEHWHKGKQRTIDAFQQATVMWLMEGKINPAVVLWGEDLQTEDQAYYTVKRELHL